VPAEEALELSLFVMSVTIASAPPEAAAPTFGRKS
jgi:hypothetical protein